MCDLSHFARVLINIKLKIIWMHFSSYFLFETKTEIFSWNKMLLFIHFHLTNILSQVKQKVYFTSLLILSINDAHCCFLTDPLPSRHQSLGRNSLTFQRGDWRGAHAVWRTFLGGVPPFWWISGLGTSIPAARVSASPLSSCQHDPEHNQSRGADLQGTFPLLAASSGLTRSVCFIRE